MPKVPYDNKNKGECKDNISTALYHISNQATIKKFEKNSQTLDCEKIEPSTRRLGLYKSRPNLQ